MATNDKYDRQLRLWGPAGQRNLSMSHVLLVQADAVGAETLKNLVLPGIGSFTILDDHRVSADDLGNNFFVTMDSVGKPRAEVVCELLCEMNADVKGYARVGNFQNILETEPNYFAHFNLVICANIPRYQVASLAQHCWENFVPFICIRSVGFLGSIHIQAREHFITEVRSDSIKHDLRISQPFPGLKQLTDMILPPHCTYTVRDSEYAGPCEEKNDNVLVMDSMFCSHIPFPILLLRMLTTWQEQHGAQNPVSAAEKNELRQLIKTFGKGVSQSNVTEALKEVSCCWDTPVPHALQWILQGTENGSEDDTGNELFFTAQERLYFFAKKMFSSFLPLNNNSNNSMNNDIKISELMDLFSHPATCKHRLLLYALCQFVSQRERLPLSGSLPDMTATSALYIQLQQTYATQATQDKLYMEELLRNIVKTLQLEDKVSVTEEDTVSLCKGAASIGLICTPPLFHSQGGACSGLARRGEGVRQSVEEVLEQWRDLQDTAQQDTDSFLSSVNELRHSPVLWLLVLEATENFYARYFRHPGDGDTARDTQLLLHEMRVLCETLGLDVPHLCGANDDTPTNNGCVAMDVDHNNTCVSATPLLGETHAHEMVRYGDTQLHNLSALLGGIAAQEAVKLATHIFVPVNNVYVFNGIASVASSFVL